MRATPLRSALEVADHVCSLYNTPEDCQEVLGEFVELGMARGEKCLCLVSQAEEAVFRRTMYASDSRFARGVEAGTIEIAALESTYITAPERFASHALDFWSEATEQARAAGFSGLRGVVCADRTFGDSATQAHWIDYEIRLTQALSQNGGALLGLYNRRAHPAEFIRELLRCHAVVAHRGRVGENTFHVPLSEYEAPDRADREVDGMLAALSAGWEVTEYVGTMEDIAERRHGEESLGNMQAELARATREITLGQLMASIAHEVNQPLTALIANAAAGLRWLAGEKPRLDRARQALTRIVRDGNRASEVIARIRALVRRADAERNALDLNGVIEDVIALLKTELRTHKVILKTRLRADLPSVWGDRVQLQQVLLNLIMNALESMSAVATRTRLLTIATRADDAGVSVRVKDCGVGLDDRSLERVFEPFYTTKPRGMGIGLTISRSIVETHGGLLWAACNRGPGAVFEFRLPTARTDAGEAVQTNRIRRR